MYYVIECLKYIFATDSVYFLILCMYCLLSFFVIIDFTNLFCTTVRESLSDDALRFKYFLR